MNEKGTVRIKFTCGFGNNLFQYVFGRLFAETYGLKLYHAALPAVGIAAQNHLPNPNLDTVSITSGPHPDTVYHEYFDGDLQRSRHNYFVEGYFEDFTLYQPHLERIRSWFPAVPKTNTKDLVLHMRLHNRALQWGHYMNHITAEAYKRAISRFTFDRLYIVSDAESWGTVTPSDIKRLTKKVQRDTTRVIKRVPLDDSVNYINQLVEGFRQYDPIFRHTALGEDFNFIRSFDKIVVFNSTFAWWAAVLSEASEVGVFGPWKPRKAGGRNKNLGKTDFPGWFSWGTRADLLIRDQDLAQKELQARAATAASRTVLQRLLGW